MRKILVTGTRGKSSLVRLLHGALSACGIKCYGRLTGVIPRQLGPGGGQTTILRAAGGHVGEMRWWLERLPPAAGAVILENSAVAPELQPLAAHWLRPEVVVLTNVRADHFETWGPSKGQAAAALLSGIPAQATVIAPHHVLAQDEIRTALAAKGCRTAAARPETANRPNLAQSNLALAVCDHLGLPREKTEPALCDLAPDLADFRVMPVGGAKLAFAFSANDPESTQILFSSLGWPPAETRLVYNHRRDRPARLREFARLIFPGNWRERLIIGQRPWPLPKGTRYQRISTPAQFRFSPGERIFGCGNVQGMPLKLLTDSAPDFLVPVFRHGAQGACRVQGE